MRDLRPDDADANEKSWLTTPVSGESAVTKLRSER
jgi:hypothetical protein